MSAPHPHSHHESNHAPHGLAAELALGTLAVLVVLFVAVYLPIGLAAVTEQASSHEMRRILYDEAEPRVLRLFAELEGWTVPLLCAAVAAACLNVLLRRVMRQRLAWGGSLAWDVIGSPLLVVLAAAALVAALATMLVRTGAGAAGLLALAAAAAAATLSVGGFAAYAWRRFRSFRWAVVAALGALALLRVGGDLWGRAALRAYDARWEKEASAERARRLAADRPVLRGPGLDEDAAPRYEAVLERLHAEGKREPSQADLFALDAAASHGPFAPVPARVREIAAARAQDVAEIRAATACRRSGLGREVTLGGSAPGLPRTPLRWIFASLIVACHEHAQRGELGEAASCYLDGARFASDVSAGSLLEGLLALRSEEAALTALGRLALSQKLDGATLARVERERARLEPFRVSVADATRGSRLLLGRMQQTLAEHPEEVGLRAPPILPWLVPYRALAAGGVAAADALYREREAALAADDAAAVARLAARAESQVASSLNPIRRTLSGMELDGSDLTPRLLVLSRRGLAFFRLVEAAVALEAQRLSAGRYPREAEARLPADPYAAGASLRFASDGPGLRLWSVGADGRDEQGNAKGQADVVLARE